MPQTASARKETDCGNLGDDDGDGQTERLAEMPSEPRSTFSYEIRRFDDLHARA